MKRLTFINGELGNLRLAYRTDSQFAHTIAEPLRKQAVNNLFADLGGKTAADNGLGHFAGPKAGKLGEFLIIAGDAAKSLRDFVGGYVKYQLARTLRIEHRPVLMLMVVIVAFVVVRLLGCTRGWISFESVSGAQRFTFRARQAPILAATAGCRRVG